MEAQIVTASRQWDWESLIVAGSLLSAGIPSRLSAPVELWAPSTSITIILDPTVEADLARVHGTLDPVLYAGRRLTYLYHAGHIVPHPDSILIYGEPYATLTTLLQRQDLRRALRGQVIRGQQLDLDAYRTPRLKLADDQWYPILTSLGCEKQCGYCPYGKIFGLLYGAGRRSRQSEAILSDLQEFTALSGARFQMIADQFLSLNPQDNAVLGAMSLNWRRSSGQRVALRFTVAPKEVRQNERLIGDLAESFTLYPSLSIDTFDPEMLCRWNLVHSCPDAIRAAEFLINLNLPIRINYIFLRPGLTVTRLRAELQWLKRFADVIEGLEPEQQLIVCADLFLTKLDVRGLRMYGLTHVPETYEVNYGSSLTKIVAVILEAFRAQVTIAEHSTLSMPMRSIVDAGELALREFGSAG